MTTTTGYTKFTPPTKLEISALERAREHAPATMAVLEATGGWDAVADRAEAEENARRESISRVEKKLRRERQGLEQTITRRR